MTRPLAFVCFVAFFLTSHTTWAKPKVALTEIDGDASGDVRDAVAEALESKELSLISSKEVNRAVGKLGDLADLSEKDLKKLATDLEADAIVIGKLEKAGGSKSLKFKLYVHKKMAKGFTVNFKDAKSEKFHTLLHDKMLDKIGTASDADDEKPVKKKGADDEEDPLAGKKDKPKKAKAGKGDAGDDPDTKPKKAKAGKGDAGDDPDAKPKKAKADKGDAGDDPDAKPKKAKADKGDAGDDPDAKPKKAKADKGDDGAKPDKGDDAKPASGDDAEVTPRRSKKKVATSDDGDDLEGGISATGSPASGRVVNRPAIRVDIGASVVKRSFTFAATKSPTSPKNTPLSPVPGARLDGEIYPLALSNPRGGGAGLGLGFDYDKTLALNLVASNAAGTTTKVPVSQSHYGIDVRYRLAFGQSETSPTLTLGVGYGKRTFAPDRSTDAVVMTTITRDTPATAFTMIDPGLTFRLPVTQSIALSLGGRGMIVTNAGPIQAGTSYGRAKVYGAEGVAALDVMLGNRFALRFAGEFVQIGFTFLGGAALSNGLDGNLATKDVGGLADRSLGGSATLGVVY